MADFVFQPETPIEKLFRESYNNFKLGLPPDNKLGYDNEFTLRQQEEICSISGKTYFIDFYEPQFKLCIELDGHDFHSSKEDLKRDKSKDRDLKKSGYTVIRFTGSEVFRNSTKCLDDVYSIYCSIVTRN